MRTKTCARRRLSRSSRRSSSATTSRPLPPPTPDINSNEDDSMDRVELDNSTGSGSSLSMDSSGDDTIVKTCVKCDKGEQLLFCSRVGCPIVVHEQCIGSESKYDKERNFYCPYCWYRLLRDQARAMMKEATLAKNDLAEFMAFKPLVSSDKDKDGDVRTPNVGKIFWENKECQNEDRVDVDDELHSVTCEVEEKLPNQSTMVAESEIVPETCLEDEGGMGKERDDQQVVDETNGEIDAKKVPTEKKHDDHQVIVEKDEEINDNEVPVEKDNGDHQVNDGKNEEMNDQEVPMEKENGDHQVIDERIEGINAEEVSMKEQEDIQPRQPPVRAEKSSPLKKHMQSQVSANKSTKLPLVHEKRKRLFWRPEEEDMLREGVQTFSSKVNKNLPWRKILEMGHHVFDSSRTPSDLKDKWRNMQKSH